MVPEDIHDFFMGAAGVAGALIGLLFVAISVVGERLARSESGMQIHRIRAYGALVAFVNALAISLFALVPGQKIGWASVALGAVGLGFILAALLSLTRVRPFRWSTARDGTFLIGLAVVFFTELTSGLDVAYHPNDSGTVNTIAILVVCCFLIGISRAWELIGGPSLGVGHEVFRVVRREELMEADAKPATAAPATEAKPPEERHPGQQ